MKINCEDAMAGDGWVGMGVVASDEKGYAVFAAMRRDDNFVALTLIRLVGLMLELRRDDNLVAHHPW